MTLLDLGNDESLFYLYTPSTNRKPTVVFVNALVGSTEMWEGFIGETLGKRVLGHYRIILGGRRIVNSI